MNTHLDRKTVASAAIATAALGAIAFAWTKRECIKKALLARKHAEDADDLGNIGSGATDADTPTDPANQN